MSNAVFRQLCFGARWSGKRDDKVVTMFKKKEPPPPVEEEAPTQPASTRRRRTPKASTVRKQHHLSVQGDDPPNPVTNFDALETTYSIPSTVLQAFRARRFTEPTPIQMQCFTCMLRRRDLIASAPTGSGKTLAFLLPVFQMLGEHCHKGLRALVVSPTRELAQQTERELSYLCDAEPTRNIQILRMTQAMLKSTKLNKHDVLVTTPKRVTVSLTTTALDLSQVRHVVFDEADILFESGFQSQIHPILAACTHPELHKAVFGATIPETVEAQCREIMTNPVSVFIGRRLASCRSVEQKLLYCGTEHGKLLTLKQVYMEGVRPPTLLFVDTKERADQLYVEMREWGATVGVVHNERSNREETIKAFRRGTILSLISTDLLERGIDFKAVGTVIQYDFPRSLRRYVHRAGRTGRGQHQGQCITLYTDDDKVLLRSIAYVIKQAGCPVEDWMIDRLKTGAKEKRRAVEAEGTKRRSISGRAQKVAAKERKRRTKKRPRDSDTSRGGGDHQVATEGAPPQKKRKKASSTAANGKKQKQPAASDTRNS